MRVTVERIEPKDEEELIVRCYDPGAAWVSSVKEAASDHRTICGWQEDTMHRLRLAVRGQYPVSLQQVHDPERGEDRLCPSFPVRPV